MAKSNTKYIQHFLIIPGKLFEALGWKKGTEVCWKIMGRDKVMIEKVK